MALETASFDGGACAQNCENGKLFLFCFLIYAEIDEDEDDN